MFKINTELTADEWTLLWALIAVKKDELKKEWRNIDHLENLSNKLFNVKVDWINEEKEDRF